MVINIHLTKSDLTSEINRSKLISLLHDQEIDVGSCTIPSTSWLNEVPDNDILLLITGMCRQSKHLLKLTDALSYLKAIKNTKTLDDSELCSILELYYPIEIIKKEDVALSEYDIQFLQNTNAVTETIRKLLLSYNKSKSIFCGYGCEPKDVCDFCIWLKEGSIKVFFNGEFNTSLIEKINKSGIKISIECWKFYVPFYRDLAQINYYGRNDNNLIKYLSNNNKLEYLKDVNVDLLSPLAKQNYIKLMNAVIL